MSVVGVNPTILHNGHTGLSLSRADAKIMRELDASVDVIRTYIPTDPYILTVPSTDPYQHRSRQDAEAWRRGTFFDSDEDEEVQYSTFLYREQGESLFVCRSTVDIERDRREKERKLNGVRSGANTPSSSTGPKKKISLSAYKSKHAQVAGSKKVEKGASPGNEMLSGCKDTQAHDKPPALLKTAAQAGQKRSSNFSESQNNLHADDDPAETEKPVAKKSRLSPEPQRKDPQVQTIKKEPHELPPKLSPEREDKEQGLPPLLSPESLPNRHGLPHQLSPTLPPDVESEIKRSKGLAEVANSVASSNQGYGGKRLPSTKEPMAAKTSNTTDMNGDNKSFSSKAQTSASSNGETKRTAQSQRSEAKGTSMIVKFRFSKKFKREFERLIKLPTKRVSVTNEDKDRKERKEEPEASRKASASHVADQSKANGEKPAAYSNDNKSPGKRKRDAQEAEPGLQTPKRQKAPSSKKPSPHPHTPAHQPRSSPNLNSNAAAIKNRHLTPSKTAARVPLKRTASGDSLSATPIGLENTPIINRNMPPTANALSDEWLRIGRDMNESARDLKRAAQDLLKQEDVASNKQGVLMTMEALLYYTLVYCTRDQSSRAQDRPLEVKRWLTILPLWKWCNNNVKAFPHLQGLCQQLGLVIRMHIAANAGKKAHLGVTSLAGGGDDDELRSFLAENAVTLSELARESSKNLSVQALVAQYPQTWKGQSNPSELSSAIERLVPDKYDGPYFLPLGLHTSPIHAVRMGRAFLAEWVEQERLDYTFSLNL